MDKSACHSIQKYSFEVNYDSEEKAFEFQNEIIAYIKEELLPLTDTVLTESDPNVAVRIQNLKLELGEFYTDSYREDIKIRFRSLLIEKLRMLTGGHGLDDEGIAIEYVDPVKDNLEEFSYYLKTGIFPWNTKRAHSLTAFNHLFESLYAHNSSQLKKTVSQIIDQKEAALRLIRQLNEENKWSLVSLWLDSKDSIIPIKNFYSDLLIIYQHKKVYFNYLTGFKEQIWLFLLREVIVSKISFTDSALFFSKFLYFLSVVTKTDFEKVIDKFKSVLFPGAEYSLSANTLTTDSRRLDLQSGFMEFMAKSSKEDLLQLKYRREQSENFTGNVNTETIVDREKVSEPKEQEEPDKILKKKKELLILFLKNFFLNPVSFQSNEIEEIEILIKELSRENSFKLSESVVEHLPNRQETYDTIRLIELFKSDEVKRYLWKEIAEEESIDYAEFKRTFFLKAVISILTNGIYYTSYQFRFPLTKKLLQEMIQEVISNQGKELTRVFRSQESELKPENWNALDPYLNSDLRKKLLNFIGKTKEQLAKEAAVQEKSVKVVNLQDLSDLPSRFHYLSYYINHKKLPAYCEFEIQKLLELILETDQSGFIDFIIGLKTKKANILLKEIPGKVRKVISEKLKTSKKLTAELSEVLREVIEAEKSFSLEETKNKSGAERSSEDPVYTIKKIQEGEPVYISNAGLVIFHPYLPRFFKLLNLIDKRQFTDEYSAHKAAHILQYLVNKSEQSEEHELFLNKILCGIEPEIPLMREIEISDKEKELCEELLTGVIQNWPILKKTSNDNFRASFLIRDGRMILEPQGWKLRVEEKGYDVLVEKIPWSLSMIMLPWMKKIMYVEWK